MDVVSQALHVAAEASETAIDSIVSLDFDLELPAHRAAYAAAMAVLASFGEAPEGMALPVPTRLSTAVDVESVAILDVAPEVNPLEEALRRAYLAAMDELAGDPAKAARAVGDTFPIVREVLRDGANVEGVAHVQYMRWTDAQRAVRSSLD